MYQRSQSNPVIHTLLIRPESLFSQMSSNSSGGGGDAPRSAAAGQAASSSRNYHSEAVRDDWDTPQSYNNTNKDNSGVAPAPRGYGQENPASGGGGGGGYGSGGRNAPGGGYGNNTNPRNSYGGGGGGGRGGYGQQQQPPPFQQQPRGPPFYPPQQQHQQHPQHFQQQQQYQYGGPQQHHQQGPGQQYFNTHGQYPPQHQQHQQQQYGRPTYHGHGGHGHGGGGYQQQHPRGPPPSSMPPAAAAAMNAAVAAAPAMHPLLEGVARSNPSVPLPPMPAPLAYNPAASAAGSAGPAGARGGAYGQTGPEWHGGRQHHKHQFKDASRLLLRDVADAARIGGVSAAPNAGADPLPPPVLAWALAELAARERDWRAAADAARSAAEAARAAALKEKEAGSSKPASASSESASSDASKSEETQEQTGTEADTTPKSETDKAEAKTEMSDASDNSENSKKTDSKDASAAAAVAVATTPEERLAASKVALLAELPADSPYHALGVLDAVLDMLRTFRGYTRAPGLSLPFLQFLEAKFPINPVVMLYCLIRIAVRYPVAPVVKAYIALQASPSEFVNLPIPTEDSWFIHRAVWEGDRAVVRALASFGAITNRYNQYGEHPVQVINSRLEQQTEAGRRPYNPFWFEANYAPQITRADVDAMRGVLQETLFSGAGPRAPDAVLLESMKQAELESTTLWLQSILADGKKKAAAAAAAGTGARSGDAAEGDAEGAEAKAEGDEGVITQNHVFVYGIPFEYPLADIKSWFSACGEITRMHAFVNKGSFTDVKEVRGLQRSYKSNWVLE